MISNFIWAAVGGALGSVLRLGVGLLLHTKAPLGTLAVNFIGSLLIGVLLRNIEHGSYAYHLLVVGLCGGFTTFSTFSMEVAMMLKNGNTQGAVLYILSSLIVCVIAVLIGFKIKF